MESIWHRTMRTARSFSASGGLALLLALLPWGCDEGGPSSPDTSSLEITLRVSGGIAGADFTVRVDGEERVLRGVSCVNLCDFQEGELLLGLSPGQLSELGVLAGEAGLPGVGDRDFGTECCDLFRYELEYADGQGRARIVGDDLTLPAPLAALAGRIHAMAGGTLPALVALDTERSDWPDDGLTLHSAELVGGVLAVDLSYGGGCRPHDLDLVVYGGWMESSPVRVRAALAHDARGDACEALIRRDLKYDLAAVTDAYDRDHPDSPGGPLTLLLENPAGGEALALTLAWRSDEG